jgi:hypothetical protein
MRRFDLLAADAFAYEWPRHDPPSSLRRPGSPSLCSMVDHLTSLLYVLLPWNWKTESEDVSIFAASRDQPISSGSNRFAAIPGRTGFAQDSSLEGRGFEPSVPLLSLLPPDLRLATVPGEDWLVAPIPSASVGLKRPEVIALWEGKSAPHPLATLTQPVQLTGGIGRVKQKMYILATDPARFTDGTHLALHYFHAARNARRTDGHPAEGNSLEGVGPGPVQDSRFCRQAAPQQLWRLAASRQPQLSLLRAK